MLAIPPFHFPSSPFFPLLPMPFFLSRFLFENAQPGKGGSSRSPRGRETQKRKRQIEKTIRVKCGGGETGHGISNRSMRFPPFPLIIASSPAYCNQNFRCTNSSHLTSLKLALKNCDCTPGEPCTRSGLLPSPCFDRHSDQMAAGNWSSIQKKIEFQ